MTQIEKRTIGIAFLGTPHHGADIASWGSYATAVVNIARNANKDIVGTLKPDSEMLQITQENFYDVLERRKREDRSVEITCFYEELAVKAIGFVSTPVRVSFVSSCICTVLRRCRCLYHSSKYHIVHLRLNTSRFGQNRWTNGNRLCHNTRQSFRPTAYGLSSLITW